MLIVSLTLVIKRTIVVQTRKGVSTLPLETRNFLGGRFLRPRSVRMRQSAGARPLFICYLGRPPLEMAPTPRLDMSL